MEFGCATVRIWRRLAFRRVPGCHDELKVLIEPGAAQDGFDLVTKRTGGDAERVSRRHQLDARGRAGIQDGPRIDTRLDGAIEYPRLLVDQCANALIVHVDSMPRRQLRE